MSRMGIWKMLSVIALFAVTLLFYGQMHRGQAETVDDIENCRKVLILNYHKVDDLFNSLSVSPSDFAEQMDFLNDNGYTTITPKELCDGIAGVSELPKNPVLITFDDGYLDNYTNAYPILKARNMKATIFAIAGFIGTHSGYMNWSQLREMEQHGISIESHTMNHKPLEGLSDDQIRTELTDSKDLLEQQLGHPIKYIAYPTGTYNLHIASLAKAAGYEAAFTVKYGNVDMGSNVYALERVPVFQTEDTMKSFYERLHYRPIFERFGWKKN